MVESRLQVVGQETAPDPFPIEQPKPIGTKIATDAITLALSALSQRAVIGLSALFTLLTVASAFVLWYVTPNPDVYQLVKLAMYGAFLIGINWIIHRRR